jgi:YD repeat-containing protein
MKRIMFVIALSVVWVMTSARVDAQTLTLHFHKETDTTGGYLLRSTGPDAAAFAIVSIDWKNTPLVDYPLFTFHADPAAFTTGVLPANSVMSITVWMKKSSTAGTVFPTLSVSANGQTACPTTVGTAEITTTLTQYTVSCTTQADMVLLSNMTVLIGRHFSALPGNKSVTLEMDVEGTLNGNYDSRLTMPQPTQGATITSLNRTDGVAGDAIVIAGSGFGALQGSSGVTFNGAAANVSSWSDGSLSVQVPTGATTGGVIAWVGNKPSNSIPFTVYGPPSLTSVSPTGGVSGQSISIVGANFETLQGSGTVALNGSPMAVTSWSDTAIATTIPIGATSGPIIVTTRHGQSSNSIGFRITPTGGATSTYHLHKEASTTTGLFQLKPGGPDGTSLAIQTTDLKSQTSGWFVLQQFDTQAGVPNVSGIIPAGSTVSFNLWMKKTADFGVLLPMMRAKLNTSTGTSLCEQTGSSGLTSTLNLYALSCTTSVDVVVSPSDRLYLWVAVNLTTGPGNHSVKGELDVEGTLNGNYDSRIVVPTIIVPPVLSTLSTSVGQVGQPVTLTGLNFGTTQELSTVTFGGLAAPIASWSDTSVSVTVPTGTIGGPVVMTRLQSSNALPFTILGSVGGTIRTGNGGAVEGATVQALQGTQVQGSAASGPSGSYVIANLVPGTYDITVSMTGIDPQSRSVVVPSAGQATADFSVRGSGAVTYTYDALNRLTSVADGQGGWARYVYDSVGNVLAIERNATASVSILSLFPKAGPAGTVVTIGGTGFNAQASQNTVQFNGTSATVISATATQLTVTVPAGASTGLVTVSTVNGTATSSGLFTISPTAGSPPAITSFSPGFIVSGAAVTINGSFDTAANILRMNQSTLSIFSSSPTVLTTAVPGGVGTGRFTVTTPTGTATSATDLFVRPPTFDYLTNEFTGRTTIGQPINVTLPNGNSGTYGLIAFDGTAGQRVSVKATNVTGTQTCNGSPTVSLFIFRPDDGFDTPLNPPCRFVGPYNLPLTGTYTVGVYFGPTSTVTIYDIHDKTAPIVINGPSSSLAVDTPGQTVTWTFAGIAGQPITVSVAPGGSGFQCYPYATATLRNPSGSQIASFNVCGSSSPQRFTLAATGNYTITYDQFSDFGGTAPSARVTSP